MQFDPDVLVETARELVDKAAQRGVTLRTIGHLAVRAHIQERLDLIDLLQRLPTHDIDFMGRSEEQNAAHRLFVEDLGYRPDPAIALSQEYGIKRLIYYRDDGLLAEIFLDELRMAHTLDFRDRLELDYPTISLVDLLLSKLQIQQITEKDIKDMIVLLAEHDLGSDDRECVDVDHLVDLTRDDWGLYHTASTNLAVVGQWLEGLEVIDASTRENVRSKLAEIVTRMEAGPKTVRWKIRSKIGTRLKWYEDVGKVHR